ncbi:hypothetical protein [Streptomyces sp. SID3212]|uniref:hypothetical protein n=1 Tax=Streptomyces sp. SID3212 TaxID=2690259 RepID=UPI001371B637|nr:hypothetical protein [Streptomyces sp. SID3212]MYV58046.1 hypothetical protein [Streptomyces sp. SID3212]
MTAKATYEIWIDWDGDGGLFAGNFEGTLDGWQAEGTTVPALELSAAFSHISGRSMEITWTPYVPGATGDTGTEVKFDAVGRGFDQGRFGGATSTDVLPPIVTKGYSNLIPGRQYSFTAWVYVPTGGEHVRIGVDSISISPASSVLNGWQQLTCVFVAVASQHTLRITAAANTAGGELTYIDEIMVTGPGENVTQRVLGLRTPLDISYGRDQSRSLSSVQPGETTLEIDNRSRDYSPDNPGSVIAGFLSSGKQVLIKATYQEVSHVMFSGYLQDYGINPDKNSRSVTFSCYDVLSKLNANISTPMYEMLRTGDGVHAILDAIGWPIDKRDIDPGATIMSYWWAEEQSGLEALNAIMGSEGPPSIAYVDSANNFVFRDRHHRLLYPASITSQASIVDKGEEPMFSSPMTYDIGWKDVVNTVSVDIDQRQPGDIEAVFTGTDIIALGAGESRTISIKGDSPFMSAITPELGVDYTVPSGSVTVSLSRDSGESADVVITAITAATINGMIVRARPVTVARTVKVLVQDPGSISGNGIKSYDGDMPWANVNDAHAVGSLIIGQRSQRLPIVTITIKNANPMRMNQILTRDISDRIHIVEDETFTDHDYYIEKVQHSIADIGHDHSAIFSCERARTQVSPVFTFDDSAKGFDDGLFGLDGFDDPATVFILDQSTLDTGLLGT